MGNKVSSFGFRVGGANFITQNHSSLQSLIPHSQLSTHNSQLFPPSTFSLYPLFLRVIHIPHSTFLIPNFPLPSPRHLPLTTDYFPLATYNLSPDPISTTPEPRSACLARRMVTVISTRDPSRLMIDMRRSTVNRPRFA